MIALDILNSVYIYTMFQTTVIKQQHILLQMSIINIIILIIIYDLHIILE